MVVSAQETEVQHSREPPEDVVLLYARMFGSCCVWHAPVYRLQSLPEALKYVQSSKAVQAVCASNHGIQCIKEVSYVYTELLQSGQTFRSMRWG